MPRLFRSLRPVDALIAAFALLLDAIVLSAAGRIGDWAFLLGLNTLAVTGILAAARLAETNRIVRAVHDWYPVPVIFLVFKEMHVIIQSLARADWDPLLIRIDRALFGTDPTVWMGTHATPLFTEILQLAYVSYYFILLSVGVELVLTNDRARFSYVLFVIVYGFFLSYLGYLTFPAVGPRFTLHDFAALNTELPGLWLTNGIRDFLNAGESIPGGIAGAVRNAQRDAFPSGHTQMTLISLFLAFRYRLRSRWVLSLFGTLLIVSTVYLRYHYVVDLLGGLLFAAVTVSTAPWLFARWEKARR
jgi:membrane-associated phospholipid phosphatase